MKKRRIIAILALALSLYLGFSVQADGAEGENESESTSEEEDPGQILGIEAPDQAKTFTYGQKGSLTFTLTNKKDQKISNVIFRLVQATDSVSFPFELQNDSHFTVSEIAPNGTENPKVTLKTRNDVVSGYRRLDYTVTFDYEGESYTQEGFFYVNIQGNPYSDDPSYGQTEPEEATEPATVSDPGELNDIKISVGVNQSTPYCVYGQPVDITLTFLNNGGNTANGVFVTPVVDSDSNVFPFEIQQMDQTENLETLVGTSVEPDAAKRVKGITYNWVTRKDVTTGYKKISFQIDYYTDSHVDKSITKDIYVMVQGNPEEDEAAGETGEKENTSIPRVIVSGFKTDPEEIYAGDSFLLTLEMTNTSKSTAVGNMVFNLQSETISLDSGAASGATAAAFLPTSGSSSIFVDSIGPNQTKEISIELESRSDLSPRPYVITVDMDYEDGKKNDFEATSSVSIPVRQEDKIETSTPELMPESIQVGSQTNMMFSIYNTGKTKLYNVMVRFEGDSIEPTECFVGNVDAGGTGNVDVMLTGLEPTMDEGTLIAEIQYENQSGEAMEIEKEYTLFVSEPVMEEYLGEEMMGGEALGEEGKTGSKLPLILGIVAAAAVVGAGAAVAAAKIRKKKKALSLESEDIDEIE